MCKNAKQQPKKKKKNTESFRMTFNMEEGSSIICHKNNAGTLLTEKEAFPCISEPVIVQIV